MVEAQDAEKLVQVASEKFNSGVSVCGTANFDTQRSKLFASRAKSRMFKEEAVLQKQRNTRATAREHPHSVTLM